MNHYYDDVLNVYSDQLLDEYSEGSASLRKLLSFLWKSGVRTYACCKGHSAAENKKRKRGGEPYFPYIMFDITPFSPDEICDLVVKVFEISSRRRVAFSVDLFGENGAERKALSISFSVGFNFNILLRQIENVIKGEPSPRGWLSEKQQTLREAVKDGLKIFNLDLKREYSGELGLLSGDGAKKIQFIHYVIYDDSKPAYYLKLNDAHAQRKKRVDFLETDLTIYSQGDETEVKTFKNRVYSIDLRLSEFVKSELGGVGGLIERLYGEKK